MNSVPGFQISVHSALTKPILMMGASRSFTLLNAFTCLALLFGFHSLLVIPVSILIQIIAGQITKKDPNGFEILLRHIKQKNYYKV